MFHKASVKLAALYLAIIMCISLFFSLSIYQLSAQEFDRGLRRPTPMTIGGPGRQITPELRDELLHDRELQYKEAEQRIFMRLLFVNFVILIGGGFLSYYLALRTLKPIEKAHVALERFTADASHELRTPLAVMQSEIEVALMSKKLTLAESKEILQSNLEELTKLTVLSEGLLSLAQLEGTGQPYTQVVTREFVEAAVNQTLPLAEKRNILITTTDTTDTTVLGDSASLTQAIVALLDNAVKYSPEKTEIKVSAKDKQKNVVIEVADRGVGMKDTDLLHIFNRFYRADAARTKTHTNGFGIGLSIAKQIIELHKGTIIAQSKPGHGSTFTINLPKT